ncbi:MAG: alternative oxidase [Minisyncoccia bacterium]
MPSDSFKMNDDYDAHEKLVVELNDDALRAEYAKPLDNYKPGIVPSLLGWLLVFSGNLVYGKKPSYAKFKAVEVIARIPYQSWESVSYTLLTAFYGNESYAIRLCKMAAFGRFAQDNETMHVVVISDIVRKLGKDGFFLHTLVPLLFSFFYFWTIYLVYMFSNRAALELNYLFESHAYTQYSEFLKNEGGELRKRPVESEFLEFYGRQVRSEYELFASIRNDELIHRNRSIREIALCEGECDTQPV